MLSIQTAAKLSKTGPNMSSFLDHTMHGFNKVIQFREALNQRWRLLMHKEQKVVMIGIISWLCSLNYSHVSFPVITWNSILTSHSQSLILGRI